MYPINQDFDSNKCPDSKFPITMPRDKLSSNMTVPDSIKKQVLVELGIYLVV